MFVFGLIKGITCPLHVCVPLNPPHLSSGVQGGKVGTASNAVSNMEFVFTIANGPAEAGAGVTPAKISKISAADLVGAGVADVGVAAVAGVGVDGVAGISVAGVGVADIGVVPSNDPAEQLPPFVSDNTFLPSPSTLLIQ
jgi:hypothetical protein